MRLIGTAFILLAAAAGASASAQKAITAPPSMAVAASVTFPIKNLIGTLEGTKFLVSVHHANLSTGGHFSLDQSSNVGLSNIQTPLKPGRYRVSFTVTHSNIAWTRMAITTNGVRSSCAIAAQTSYSGPSQTCSGAIVTTTGEPLSFGVDIPNTPYVETLPTLDMTIGDITIVRFDDGLPPVAGPKSKVGQSLSARPQ